MMYSTRLLCVFAAAVGVASAASSYKLNIYSLATAGTTELKPGVYQVEVQGDKAVFTIGKKTFEIPATVEKTGTKFSATTYTSDGSKIKEIDLGGTNEKLVFSVPAQSSSGTK